MSDSVKHRWAQPARVMNVSTDTLVQDTEIGRPTEGLRMRLHPEDVQRMREGRICLRCLEPFREAFPEKCGVCGYAVKKNQAHDFSKHYGGVERNPRAVRIESELDKLDDKHERNFWVPKPGIIVPKWPN